MPLRRLIKHRLARFGKKMHFQDQERTKHKHRRATVRLSLKTAANHMPSFKHPSKARTLSQHPNGFNSARKPTQDLGNSKNHNHAVLCSQKEQSRKVLLPSPIVYSRICRKAECISIEKARSGYWLLERKTQRIIAIAFLNLAI